MINFVKSKYFLILLLPVNLAIKLLEIFSCLARYFNRRLLNFNHHFALVADYVFFARSLYKQHHLHSSINFATHKIKPGTLKVRSSPPEMFCEKGVLRNFAKFTGKHVCRSFFFNKVAGLGPATLLKRRT